MESATPTQSKSLQQALSFDRYPLCSGAISPPPEGLYLYYGKKKPRFIDFASVMSKDLNLLLAACDPATSGHGKEDVHGESHRKVFKMDASDFIVRSDLVGSSLVRTIEDKLLRGKTENKHIRAEPNRLNIYDKDSFLGTHKDTPQGTDMLGSLVVIYPTPHSGGELVLRRKGHEWKFDAKVLTASQTSPSLAYVAFHNDVEHEVLKVTSGHTVMVTYNLYLVDPLRRPGSPAVTRNAQGVSNLQTTLRRLLERPEFLPDGGMLGFGLAHHYPFTFETNLQKMPSCLKGEDAHVYQACRELQLQPSIQMIYDDDRYNDLTYDDELHDYERSDYRRDGIMLKEIIKCVDYDYESRSYGQTLKQTGGVMVNKREGPDPDGGEEDTNLDGDEEGAGLDGDKEDADLDDDKEDADLDGDEEDPDLDDDEEDPDLDQDDKLITWISPFNDRNKLKGTSTQGRKSEIDVNFGPYIIVPIPAAYDRVD